MQISSKPTLLPTADRKNGLPLNKLNRQDKCAPGMIYEANSCIKTEILKQMINAYNESQNKNGNEKIIISKAEEQLEILNPQQYKKILVKLLEDKLNGVCQTQKCWAKQSFIKNIEVTSRDILQNYTFRPEGPKKKNEWLNTIHINDTMKQYEKLYKDFKFLGAVPRDFDEFEELGIINLDFDDLEKKNITKLGFIFNLDASDEPGSHWVGLYTNIKLGHIYFFDSYGTKPLKEIRRLMRRLANYCYSQKIQNLEVIHNKIRHQYEGSECGVYSINFITRMLRGDSFSDICKSKTKDSAIEKCRKVYFQN